MTTVLEEKPIHILLVDDSPEDLRMLSVVLRSARFRLTVANDGRRGYQRAVVAQPDLILMDIVMPVLDGFSACRPLKADSATRHIPIIFLTAKNAPMERLQGLQMGGVDFVSKPVLPEEVVARIRIHLNRIYSAVMFHSTREDAPPMQADEVIFSAATALIRENLEQLPALPEVAHLLGTHEKRLGQVFRSQVGMTVSAFVAEERISMARRFLSDTEMNIQNIATQVGFGSAGNFTTAFRKRMGMTPTVYRQAMTTHDDELT